MEVLKAQLREILNRYAPGRITRRQCIQALNAAVVATIPNIVPAQFKELQDAVAANEECFAGTRQRPTGPVIQRLHPHREGGCRLDTRAVLV